MKRINFILTAMLIAALCSTCKKGKQSSNESANYIVITFAGSVLGDADGIGTAKFRRTGGITYAQGTIYVADQENGRIRKITPEGWVSTFAGKGTYGGNKYVDGNSSSAQFNSPKEIAADLQGNVYVTDFDLTHSYRIRKVTPAGDVSTFAGDGTPGFVDGPGVAARFGTNISGIATDISGNIYVSDKLNGRIRKITPAGEVSTLAGSGGAGFVDGNGNVARFSSIGGIATDLMGNVYVTDVTDVEKVRKITPSGVVSTLAIIDGGDSNRSRLATDAQGNVYIAHFNYNSGANQIWKITPSGATSILAEGPGGFADGPGNVARFELISGITLDAAGNIYVSDPYNYRIRKIIKK